MALIDRLVGDRGLFSNDGYDAVLDAFDTRIAVAGTRGKSSMTRWLHDAFRRRGYGAFAKITGNHPKTITNGAIEPIERSGPQVRLYENERLLRRAATALDDEETVAVCENHGLREYTMRVFNERFLEPDVVVLTNVRQDHTDTLGSSRQKIARSFARSVPPGTHVIAGEQHPLLASYLRDEVEKRGATFEHVSVEDGDHTRVGAEMVAVLDAVLTHVDGEKLPERRRDALLGELRPVWHRLPNGGRVANAAPVNDVESTEMVRRALAGEPPDAETIAPFVFLRDDRRGRTASFVDYADVLHDRGLAETIHVAGRGSDAFARRVDAPTRRHHADPGRADAVLDALLATGRPVIYMANAVDPFMRALVDETEQRALDTTRTRPDPGRETWTRERHLDGWPTMEGPAGR